MGDELSEASDSSRMGEALPWKMMTAKKKHILRFCISRLDERNHRTHEEVTEKIWLFIQMTGKKINHVHLSDFFGFLD